MTHRPTILVVEDEPIIREIIGEELEETGFRVLSAESADAAIHKIDAAGRVDAALLDIDLARRGDGYIVARYAVARRPGMLIVYTSGRGQTQHAANCVKGSLFVPKPYLPSRISAMLRERVLEAG